MPWDGCSSMSPSSRKTARSRRRARRRDGVESIWQPEWSPAGDLVFASDRSGWWNLERIRDGERTALHEREAEFGYPAWSFGTTRMTSSTTGGSCAGTTRGFTTSRCWIRRPTLVSLDLDLDSWGAPYVRADGAQGVIVAGSAAVPTQVALVDVATGSLDTLRTSVESPVPPRLSSVRASSSSRRRTG